MPFIQRSLISTFLLASCLLLSSACVEAIPIEKTMSARKSVRQFTGSIISNQLLLEVLYNSYGVWGNHRSVPCIGNDYSLTIFPVNATGSYRYEPEDNSLLVHDLTVNKETIRPHDQNWPSDANFVLVVVWNQTKMGNPLFASAEAGCLVQNVYLSTVSFNLGTTCVGSIDSEGLRLDLKLPNTMTPFLVMPLGYPGSPYPDSSPDYSRMTSNLPPVQYANLSLTEALGNTLYAQNWDQQYLSLQELSQLLWAAYGYSNTGHRTTPAANAIYAEITYCANATGTYRYIPESHSVTELQQGDKRLNIANACGGQTWAADAPAIFLITYDSAYGYDYGIVPHEYQEINTGCIAQQLILEASAWNLSANVIGNSFAEWNGTAAQQIRSILGLPSSLIPLYIVPIGHRTESPHPPLVGDINGDNKVDGKDIAIVAKYFGSLEGFPLYADINSDGKVDGKDIAIVAKHFGEHYP